MSQLAIKLPISLTAFHIKVLAVLLMVIDHLGAVFDVEELRIIGRFSFPFFAWLLTQGAKHTQNWNRYQQRLLLLAIATQPLQALFQQSLLPLNPVFQLWLGLILLRRLQEHRMTVWLWTLILGVATIFVSYHYYGIAMVYLISTYPCLLPNLAERIDLKVNIGFWIIAFTLLHFLYSWDYPLQRYALLFGVAMPLLSTIQQRGPKARWFYWFYPLHFVPLILLRGFL